MLTPDLYLTGVDAIDLPALKAKGIDALFVDLDNTILPRNSEVVTQYATDWIAAVHAAGIAVVIVSNNWHDRVIGLAEQMGVPIVAKALKPFPTAFRRACDLVKLPPSRVAVVGDQVFTDILGARLVGATSILVVPLTSSDLPHTRVLRGAEKLILGRRVPQGGNVDPS